ncbi:MAG: DUF1206 domain-containing protein [Sphingomonas sp.]
MLSDGTATVLARLGFACRGLVYVLVGWLAVQTAFSGGDAADNQGALASLGGGPAASVVLGIVAAGLIGYALWRATEAVAGARVGMDAKDTLKRAGHGVSAVTHLLLASSAIGLALHPGRGGATSPGDESARDWTAWLLEQPFGPWLVGAVALCLLVGSGLQAKKAWTGSFAEDLGGDVPAPDFARTIGRIGYGARAMVFAVMSLFFFMAAWRARAAEAGGVSDALGAMRDQPGGVVILVAIGIGLALFGVFGFVEARYRRIRVTLPAVARA